MTEDCNESLKAWSGGDVSLEISLLEQGLIWKDAGDNLHFVYRVSDDGFDWCDFKKDFDCKDEFDWIDWADVLSFCGCIPGEWDDLSLPQKISNIIDHYGYESVFGTTYAPMTIGELLSNNPELMGEITGEEK